MVLTASRGEHHHIPVPVLILHQIPMPSIDHRIIRPKIPMCKDRIARASLKPLKQLSASRHTDAVFRSGSSFCMQQIIIAVFFVQMWSLRPDCPSHSPFPDCHALSDQLLRRQIQFLHPDLPVPIVPYSIGIRSGSAIIAPAILIKKQAGINPGCFFSQITGI